MLGMLTFVPRILTATALSLLLAACSAATTDSEQTSTTAPPPASTATSTEAPTITTLGGQPDSPCLVGDRPFSTSGVISAFGGATGDAAQVSSLRAGSHPGCERVVVDLLTADGAPAGSIGLVGVEYDEEVGIVRINLPESVSRTAVADSRFDGTLADRAYVVRTTAGHLAIDIHVAAGAGIALRAFEVDAPSRIVVDLRPNPEASPVRGATVGDGVVVIEPGPGPATAPLSVAGYSRAFEANVIVRLHETRDSPPIAETVTTATDWVEVWGEFQVALAAIPDQQFELFVGSESPRDGTPQGAWLSIDPTVTDPPDPDDA